MTGPRIASYAWAGGREAMLRFGPENGPVVVAALPLFEEANRTRAFAVTLLRALAARGIAGALPDLPGTGESVVATVDATLIAMREGFAAAAAHVGGRAYAVGIRSGALLDTLAPTNGRWHLAPCTGAELLRDLSRLPTSVPAAAWLDGDDPPVEIAGNLVSRVLLTELHGALPSSDTPSSPDRTVRLDTDPRAADLKLPGSPLWRRAEPGNDPALAERLADDIAAWINRCGS